MKSSSLELTKTQDKGPLGRDLDWRWCHLHTSVKFFRCSPWLQGSWQQHGSMACDQKSVIILVVWW